MATSEIVSIIRQFAYESEHTITNDRTVGRNFGVPIDNTSRSIRVSGWHNERKWEKAKLALEDAGYTCDLITTPIRRIGGTMVGGEFRAIITKKQLVEAEHEE